ncbi:hypoxanthine-guanine phosphoribosyltransferase, partial [Tanacetum coccineum]
MGLSAYLDLENPIKLSFFSLFTYVIVGVATGAFLFLADLVRSIKLPVTVDFVRAESYGSGTVSNGAPKVSCDVKLDVTRKHV